MKPIVLTRRTTAIILSVSVIATLVAGSILANYIVPTNRVRVTAQPGLTAYEVDSLGQPTVQMVAVEWGDVQQGASQTHQVILRNTGGVFTLYILQDPRNGNTGQITTISSLLASGLPAGLSLSWNLNSPALPNAFCTVNGVQYTGCFQLSQGGGTSAITMSLSAAPDAPPTSDVVNFTIEFLAYSSPTG